MKVFLSSVITGFEPYREAAAGAVVMLGHTVVRSEQFAASPESPQVACLTGIRQSDAVVVVLGGRYGALQRSGLSATHEEYQEARATKPTLVFVQAGVERDEAQATLAADAREWAQGSIAPPFDAPDALAAAVVKGLHDLELARATGPLDQDEMLGRALDRVPDLRHTTGAASLAVVVVGGPRQSVLRPSQLEDPAFGRELARNALFGVTPLFDVADGTTAGMSGDSLVVQQSTSSLALDAEGTLVVVRPLHRDRTRGSGFQAVIEEAVRDDIEQVLRFGGAVLDTIDPTRRISHVAPVVGLVGASGAWRTRAEHAASPNTMPMNIDRAERPVARLSPPARPRQVLAVEPGDVAHDLTVLLRRAAVR